MVQCLRAYNAEGVPEKSGSVAPLGCQKAADNTKDGEEEASILQKVQVVDGKRLGKVMF